MGVLADVFTLERREPEDKLIRDRKLPFPLKTETQRLEVMNAQGADKAM